MTLIFGKRQCEKAALGPLSKREYRLFFVGLFLAGVVAPVFAQSPSLHSSSKVAFLANCQQRCLLQFSSKESFTPFCVSSCQCVEDKIEENYGVTATLPEQGKETETDFLLRISQQCASASATKLPPEYFKH